MVAPFPEGQKRVQSTVNELGSQDRLYLAAGLGPVETRARQVEIDFGLTGPWSNRWRCWALMALAYVIRREELFPLAALQAAVAGQGAYGEEYMAAIQASAQWE